MRNELWTKLSVKTTYRQVYENMASALGINLAHPTDPTSELVRIGYRRDDH
jgi:hypothetical protein